MNTKKDELNYSIAYVTPSIPKISTDFFLPTAKVIEELSGTVGIYFLQSSEGYIKIGQTKRLFQRLGTYKTHNPTIRLVGFICTGDKLLDYNENLLHRLWEPFIVNLEWFSPVRPLVQYLKNFDKNQHGIPMELIDPEPATWQELLDYQVGIRRP